MFATKFAPGTDSDSGSFRVTLCVFAALRDNAHVPVLSRKNQNRSESNCLISIVADAGSGSHLADAASIGGIEANYFAAAARAARMWLWQSKQRFVASSHSSWADANSDFCAASSSRFTALLNV